MKFGLLRAVCGGVSPLTLGVNWYLTGDESHNADGKHIGYLQPGSTHHASLRSCDRDLMSRLAEMVVIDRSVVALEESGVLPVGSLTFSQRLVDTESVTRWSRPVHATVARSRLHTQSRARRPQETPVVVGAGGLCVDGCCEDAISHVSPESQRMNHAAGATPTTRPPHATGDTGNMPAATPRGCPGRKPRGSQTPVRDRRARPCSVRRAR